MTTPDPTRSSAPSGWPPTRRARRARRRRLVLPAGAEARPQGRVRHQHIPGAVFFDIDEIADTTSPLPHMLPSPEKFSARVRKLGLGDGNKIVVYDTHADDRRLPRVVDVPRHGPQGRRGARWRPAEMAWPRAGRSPTIRTPPRDRHFTARLDNTLVRSVDDVKRADRQQARADRRRARRRPLPRRGARAARRPARRPHAGRLNLPYNELLDPETGTMLPADQLDAASRPRASIRRRR